MTSSTTESSALEALILGKPEIVAEGNQVKGNLVRSRRTYIEKHYGPEVLAGLIEQLQGQARQYLASPPMAAGWCDYAPLVEIDAAIVRGPMQGDVAKMQPFGEEIALADLNSLYKLLFKVGSPSFIISKIGMAYRQYIHEGEVRCVTVTPHHAVVEMTGGGHPRYMCRYGMTGWFEGAIRLSGGKEIKAQHAACRHDGNLCCRWDISWST